MIVARLAYTLRVAACVGIALALAGAAAGRRERRASTTTPPRTRRSSAGSTRRSGSEGLQVSTITLRWDDGSPTTIPDQAAVTPRDRGRGGERRDRRARSLPAPLAGLHRRGQVRPVDRSAGLRRHRPDPAVRRRGRRQVAAAFPTVHQFVVMNECNQPLFVNPQFDASGAEPVGRDLRPCARRRLRRAQGRQPGRTSSGASASRRAATTTRTPRATRRPRRSTSSRTSAPGSRRSRATGRTRPLMDGLDFHPYPIPQSLPFATGYASATTTRASRTCPGSTRPSTTASTARRSRRSASRRAAGCRSA